MWQLPVAVATFWKSEWGTRNTSADVAAQEKRRYEQELFVMPPSSENLPTGVADSLDKDAPTHK